MTTRPKTTQLAGSYDELTGEDLVATDIELAVRIDRRDGRTDFLIHETSADDPWEARLTAEPGSREFRGRMWSSEWDGEYVMRAELWVSPEGDEYLLLGTVESDDEESVDFKMVLVVDEQE